jgi:hypothetical protein
MKRNNFRLACAGILGALLIAACGGNLYDREIEALEKYALMNRDCMPKIRFVEEETPEYLSWVNHKRHEVETLCRSSLRLVEAVSEKDASFRRYRCRVNDRDFEVSLSAAKHYKNRAPFTWCEFDAITTKPNNDNERYTDFRRF